MPMIGEITGERLMPDENKENEKTSVETGENTTVKKVEGDSSGDKGTKQKVVDKKSDTDKTEKSAFEKSENSEFTKEYFQELREENKKYRLKAKELEDKLSSKDSEALEIAKKSLEKSNKLHNAFEKRLINAELQQIAVKEGLIDIDAFKMVDLSTVKLSEEGEVVGLDQVIKDLKTNKPYLFKLASNSQENVKNLHPADDKDKRPTYESKDDLEKAKHAYLASLK